MSKPKHDRTEEFATLSARYQRQLLGYIFTLVRNMDDAEDLLQQTNLVLWRKFEQYETGTDFIRWACCIAHLEVLNFLRQKQHRPLSLDEPLLAQLADERLQRTGFHEHYREALQRCLSKLAYLDRELLTRCYGGASQIKEIAVELGRTADSVYHSLRRIRTTLFECITRSIGREEHS